MDPVRASEKIRRKGAELGFSLTGITRAGELRPEGDLLTAWLDRGCAAGMKWMERRAAERKDVRTLVPQARSVIVVALNYYTPFVHGTDGSAVRVSRYAWGEDYHTVMGERLQRFWAWMQEEFSGVEGKWYVDTGPVMEKAWAQRAGIGWLGKHTNIISRELGSWVFFGVIISSLELEPDTPAVDRCGTCTRCIDACPTAAIVEPYVLDAGRCIPYLTIEHRGPIDPDLSGLLDGWIFGCDICQDVCPWNRKRAAASPVEEFAPRDGFLQPDVEEWGKMTPEQFAMRFAGSPVLRTKHAGFVRNLALARLRREP
jgi:epoxyqueuosine reductase